MRNLLLPLPLVLVSALSELACLQVVYLFIRRLDKTGFPGTTKLYICRLLFCMCISMFLRHRDDLFVSRLLLLFLSSTPLFVIVLPLSFSCPSGLSFFVPPLFPPSFPSTSFFSWSLLLSFFEELTGQEEKGRPVVFGRTRRTEKDAKTKKVSVPSSPLRKRKRKKESAQGTSVKVLLLRRVCTERGVDGL